MKVRIIHLHGGSIQRCQRISQQMDEGNGRVIAALQHAGVERGTLVVFTSDNGGERFAGTGRCWAASTASRICRSVECLWLLGAGNGLVLQFQLLKLK